MGTRTRSMVAAAVASTTLLLLTACGTPPPDEQSTTTTTTQDDTTCQRDRKTIETAIEAAALEIEFGHYPPSLQSIHGIYIHSSMDLTPWTYSTDGPTYTLVGPC